MTRLALGLVLLLPTLGRATPPVEELPKDDKAAKIVLIAGSNYFKPGEHDYVAACAVLIDLLKQTDGVAPVLAVNWPKKPETLAGAKAIVLFLDGGDKHPLIQKDRFAEIRKLVEGGTGIVQLHQIADYPKDFGERARALTGAAWEKGLSARAHWVDEFKAFPEHAIATGVKPFKIDDGWLTKLRFADGMKGVTPLMKTRDPKSTDKKELGQGDIVAWAYEPKTGGRSFTFTGGHLHASFAEEGYRRLLVNGILWSAGREIPKEGAPVVLDADKLKGYLTPAPAKK